MPRPDGRAFDELRSIDIEIGFQKHAEGSALIKMGDTWVLCAASVEDRVPPFIEEEGKGWVTAEYAMLPRSTHTRSGRSPGGRGKEIQRLIGRALRAAVDMRALGPRTITVDCDVLQADGGTRVASITGAWVAIAVAVEKLKAQGLIVPDAQVLDIPVAAISVGVVDGLSVLDLPYVEDSTADVDMNIVAREDGHLIEIQGTAEGNVFDRKQLDELLELGLTGIRRLCSLQRSVLEGVR